MKKTTMLTLVMVLGAVSAPNLFASSKNIEERLDRIERYMKNQTSLQVELNQKISELQNENQMLQGKLDEQDYQLKKLSDRQREIYRDLDSRIGSSTGQVMSTKSSLQSTLPRTQADQPLSEQDAYEKLFPLIRKKRYTEAVVAYQQYLEQYPDGRNVPHALYWLGQVYFVQNKPDLALETFSSLVDKYPQSPKTGGALLKMGEIKMKKREWTEAKELFSRVADQYGGSTAQLAKEQLQNIKRQEQQ